MTQISTYVLGSIGTVLCAGAAALAWAQEPFTARSDQEAPFRPLIEPEGGRPLAPVAQEAEDELDLEARLTVQDLDAREAAFDEIARLAARDMTVRSELVRLAESGTDLDLAFTARLALRESDRLSTWGRAGAGFGGALKTPDDPFDSMRRQMESLFGRDPFVDEFFTNDPFFSRPFGGGNSVFGIDPFSGSGDPFESMQQRVEEMRRQFDEMHARGRTQIEQNSKGGRSLRSMTSSSVSMSQTPDGVRVEITEDDGSGPKTEIYEADSIEDLLETYPELEGKIR